MVGDDPEADVGHDSLEPQLEAEGADDEGEEADSFNADSAAAAAPRKRRRGPRRRKTGGEGGGSPSGDVPFNTGD